MRRLTDLIGQELSLPYVVAGLPLGAVVVDGDGIAWQRGLAGRWYPASRLGECDSRTLIGEHGPSLLLAWVPPGCEDWLIDVPVEVAA